MRFDDLTYLLALLVIPVIVYMQFFWKRRRVGSVIFSKTNTLNSINRGLFSRLWRAPNVLRIIAFSLCLFAFARPQTKDRERIETEGVDVVICLDMSISMNAVDLSYQDIRELQARGLVPPNRFDIARDVIKRFVSSRRGDRIGLVVFGREAYVKFSLTVDYDRVFADLEELVLDNGTGGEQCRNDCTISGAGTAIGDALARAWKRFERSNTKSKNIILITDGENQGGEMNPETMADYLQQQTEIDPNRKVRVFTFLVGREGEAFQAAGRDPFTQVVQYRPVPFKVNPELLKEIARKTDGEFYRSTNEKQFREDFEKLEKTHFSAPIKYGKKEIFPSLLYAALILLALEFLLRFTVLRKFP